MKTKFYYDIYLEVSQVVCENKGQINIHSMPTLQIKFPMHPSDKIFCYNSWQRQVLNKAQGA